MPYATTDDGVRLYFEETGSGQPVIFVHEFAGDFRSYEPQMRYFGKRYRAIAYNARGFPPSDVPENVASYSQARAADDILAVLDHIKQAMRVTLEGRPTTTSRPTNPARRIARAALPARRARSSPCSASTTTSRRIASGP